MKFLIFILWGAWVCAGCNLFGFDEPDNDQQILSAARACLDEGDYECALDYYKQLTQGYNDVARMEEAFALLDRTGITIGTFLGAFGKGETGAAITKLADRLTTNASTVRRGDIQDALLKANVISDPKMNGLVRFIVGSSMAAELLAETEAPSAGALISQAMISNAPATCKTATCAGSGSCDNGTGSLPDAAAAGIPDLLSMTRAQVEALAGANLNLATLHAAIVQVITGLNQIGAGGKYNTGTLAFALQLNNLANGDLSTAANARCYRQVLLNAGVGH